MSYLRDRVPEKSVVLGDLETSYRISAYAPVYIVGRAGRARRQHEGEQPVRRRATDLKPFLRTGSLATMRKYHPGWVVLRAREVTPIRRLERNGLKPVYRDGRFVVFRL